ncbi:MAG: Multi-sensor signal transduction histidine kinase [Bradyrhizobium sp.]|nr:Multi-sensor signal transduction histidine kinase [Bradyrhizobium sp.]
MVWFVSLTIVIATVLTLWRTLAWLRRQWGLTQKVKDLGNSLTMLRATLDSTADSILTISPSGSIGTVINCNRQFAELWQIPPNVLERMDRSEMMAIAEQRVASREQFFRRTEGLFLKPEDETFEVLEMKDGRIVERYAKPQFLDGKIAGVILTFRDITERRRVEAELESVHRQLVDASRQAGKAEIATNVLHNVGNVLNSVNVSAILVSDSIANSKVSGLARTVALLQEHSHDLGGYLSNDPQGKLVLTYLAQISNQLQSDQDASIKELRSLGQNIEHIKEIVAMQQAYARAPQAQEIVNIRDLIEDALRVNLDSTVHSGLSVIQEFDEVPPVRLDRHKVLQILVNLVGNAKQSCTESARPDKCLTARLGTADGLISVAIIDNGVGIPAANLTKIFNHGFTTRKDGHGFGLHSAALAAKQVGGSLRAQSKGVGQGATFTLDLPLDSSGNPA